MLYVLLAIKGMVTRLLFKSLFRCHSHIKFIRTHSHEKLTLIRTYVAEIWKETNLYLLPFCKDIFLQIFKIGC